MKHLLVIFILILPLIGSAQNSGPEFFGGFEYFTSNNSRNITDPNHVNYYSFNFILPAKNWF